MKLPDYLIDFRVRLDREASKELKEELTRSPAGSAEVAVPLSLEGEEDVADVRKLGEGVCKLEGAEGVTPVFEGVEVAFGRPGAGAFATTRHGDGPPADGGYLGNLFRQRGSPRPLRESSYLLGLR